MRVTIWLCLSVLFLSSGLVRAEPLSGITVSGKATIEKAPDQFKLVVSVAERSRVAQKAKANIDHKSDQVTSVARQLGIKEQDIRSTQLQIFPIYPRINQHDNKVYIAERDKTQLAVIEKELPIKNVADLSIEFEVKRTIALTLTSFDKYEMLLDKLTKIGVTRISPVQTSITEADTLYQQALIQALDNARLKAQMLAKNLGVSLGQVSQLTEHAYRAPAKMMMAQESDSSMSRRQSFTGVDSISAEVTVTFTID